jgi:hypothetical protein
LTPSSEAPSHGEWLGRTAMKGIEMVVLSDDDMAMIRAAAQGLDGPGVEQFINNVYPAKR